jgi:hypothetical protein
MYVRPFVSITLAVVYAVAIIGQVKNMLGKK